MKSDSPDLSRDSEGRYEATLANLVEVLQHPCMARVWRCRDTGIAIDTDMPFKDRIVSLNTASVSFVRWHLQDRWGFSEISESQMLDAIAAAFMAGVLVALPRTEAEWALHYAGTASLPA